MIIFTLAFLGLCLGSFVNALVWRVRQQELAVGSKNKTTVKLKYSILNGRSMCPNCKHELAAYDLVPVISWLSLRGRCRYCKKPISVQYPVVELITAVLFITSFLFWSRDLSGFNIFQGARVGYDILFLVWLLLLTGFMALIIYDLKWYLLPNKIVFPLTFIAAVYALIVVLVDQDHLSAILSTLEAVLISGGIFYVLFQISAGKWIGGGDVKLGWVLGLVSGTPGKAILLIFTASLLGCLISLPLLATQRLKKSSIIPFGPLLIIGAFISVIFGTSIINWYQRIFI